MTEAKHIKAVKEPWRRSNRYKALGQMLQTNQRLDKLAAARVDFANRGMLDESIIHWMWDYLDRVVRLQETERGDDEGNENRVEPDEDERGQGEGEGEGDRMVINGGVDGAADLRAERMRGATIPVGTGEKSGVEEAMAADADDGWQVPNREDGGPVNDTDVINRVVLAKTARPCLLFIFSTTCDSLPSVLVLERKYPKKAERLGIHIGVLNFEDLIRRYLYQYENPDGDPDDIPSPHLPRLARRCKISVFHSAMALFHAPSDPSGIKGMRREYIHCTPKWRSDGERRDCIFVTTDPARRGMEGLTAARVFLFFSFKHNGRTHPCALVQWFPCVDEHPDDDTGMWIVRPEYLATRGCPPSLQIIHTDSIFRSAHLLPIFAGSQFVPTHLHFTDTLDAFDSFYVSKWADHNSHDVLYVPMRPENP